MLKQPNKALFVLLYLNLYILVLLMTLYYNLLVMTLQCTK